MIIATTGRTYRDNRQHKEHERTNVRSPVDTCIPLLIFEPSILDTCPLCVNVCLEKRASTWRPRGSRRACHLSSTHGRQQCPTPTDERQLSHAQLSQSIVGTGTLDERTNLGWQLMRMPVTTPPGCANACNYADFIQSGQSVVLSFILYVCKIM
ncbi:hypothetical protein LR48_Vigan02g012900 [Vigna angularis]|uniref:Uncharacterized protein n=1 Tax=Phaseolus angularis TaxID=3914 RepID=A0A0L9TV00_PHAAN|nr:hypothetical protein LR48_Vigan02g012900 [Vigna angularis]